MTTVHKKRSAVVMGVVALLAIAPFLWNYFTLQAPLRRAVTSDQRNAGIDVHAHYGSYVNPRVLVFDLRTIDGERSPTDVFRLLLQFASELQDKRFQVVQLAHRGTTKFLLQGEYFQRLGAEYGKQNPVYTMRTFPENLLRPSGEEAFPRWEGGWLGVAGRQIEDFGTFHEQWYLSDLAKDQ